MTREDLQEREERKKIVVGEEKKARNFGRSSGRGSRGGWSGRGRSCRGRSREAVRGRPSGGIRCCSWRAGENKRTNLKKNRKEEKRQGGLKKNRKEWIKKKKNTVETTKHKNINSGHSENQNINSGQLGQKWLIWPNLDLAKVGVWPRLATAVRRFAPGLPQTWQTLPHWVGCSHDHPRSWVGPSSNAISPQLNPECADPEDLSWRRRPCGCTQSAPDCITPDSHRSVAASPNSKAFRNSQFRQLNNRSKS